MIAHKMSASLTGDDKENKACSIETTPVNANMQDNIDDLNLQLACAQGLRKDYCNWKSHS